MKVPKFSKEAMLPDRFYSHQKTITSLTGAGSSTAETRLKEVCTKLPFRFVSVGGIMRTLAEENGMSIEDFAKFNRKHPELGFDKQCDDRVTLFASQNYVIVEGRLPHVFAPRAFHILLKCDLDIRAKRRISQGTHGQAVEDEVRKLIKQRDDDDNARYRKMYPGCLWTEDKYDLVIDTSTTEPGDVVQRILTGHKEWLKALPPEKVIFEMAV